MPRRLQRFFTTLREQGRVSYAKIATAGGFCSIDLILVKATAPDDFLLPERYVNELLTIFSISSSSFRAFSLSFIRRFHETRCWRVALKCLLLVHTLLRSLPDDSPFRTELLWARDHGLLLLYPCHFRDSSSSYSDDYTLFIRSYARLIDEALNIFSIGSTINECQEEDEEEKELPENLPEKMREIGRMLEVLPQLQSFIDQVMACRPTGPAASSLIVQSTMIHILHDSFLCYTTVWTEINVVLGNLFQMPYWSCISAFGIYKKVALQANQLNQFYEWCKSRGLCVPYEYPFIDQIPQTQIRALEMSLNGMWQLTESSSSATSPSSVTPSPSSSTEDDSERAALGREIVVSKLQEEFEEKPLVIRYDEEEEEPLIRLEEDTTGNDNWETLLDMSVNLSPAYRTYRSNIFQPSPMHGYRHSSGSGYSIDKNEWKLQKYDLAAIQSNPFHYQCGTPFVHGGSLIMM
ncbi:putative clathrin assembly protein At1g03050 [Punica granatum]|uniref:Clathrin assembly protein At1g03050 n=1 Tax=Punica granatum TaxID=22663 RepID=A0A6P8C791_PUNGR|nr:putative clathrin assembly protein At1g03050 [Punica granatum]